MTWTVDELYAGFAHSLPEPVRGLARDLPFSLGLAPMTGAVWSQVFSHRVTLEAPSFFAEVFPDVTPELARQALLGHALSVIEAFGTDRIADGQLKTSRELASLLNHVREARDRALELTWPGTVHLARLADRVSASAIKEEHSLLRRIAAVSLRDYKRVSLGKQAVGFPASVALARAAGASEQQIEQVRRILAGVWLGLQFEDDVLDWEDDWRRGGGAWAVSLARRRLEAVPDAGPDERPTEPDIVRQRVYRMRVLFSMLRAARHQYRTAWRYSQTLGAHQLARWVEERTQRLDTLLPFEDRHAGYVVRATKLAPWAAEVLT